MKSVDVLIPVYYGNKEEIENSCKEQIDFYRQNLSVYGWRIVIALNGRDKNGILDEVKGIADRYENVVYDYIETPGRGASLSKLFVSNPADYVCYMDVDLSTDLEALPRLLEELDRGNDLVVGSKYIDGAYNQRDFLRLFISKIFNKGFARIILNAKFSDAQCGFKGMRRDAAKRIVPLVEDSEWFWDTELLYIAQRKKIKFKEIPVRWIERGNSGVKIMKTIKNFLVKMIKLRFRKV